MLSNYHSHTKWCRHGSGEIEEYIKEAIKKGLKEYAVTEHIPYPGKNLVRLDYEEMDQFINELDFLTKKYKSQITILKGLECEYFEEYHNYYIDIKKKYNIDFLVLGQHYYTSDCTIDFFHPNNDNNIKLYEKAVIKGIESKLFDILAHPDVFLNTTSFSTQALTTTKNILRTCEKHKIAVEINANGVRFNRGYPNQDFWTESKNYKLTYLVNSDCHSVDAVFDTAINQTYDFASKLGIKVTEFINLN